MKIRIYFNDGEILIGETLCLPQKRDNGFYLHALSPLLEERRTWVGLNAVKKFEEIREEADK